MNVFEDMEIHSKPKNINEDINSLDEDIKETL